MAYKEQSKSLQYVQKFGPDLEKSIKSTLEWSKGRVIYYSNKKLGLDYDLEVDCCWPKIKAPESFVSVTYCKPDKPGHSNENKLQLKLGELMLLKAKYPHIKSILITGGNKDTWLPYVLEAFEFFFDKVIFAWKKDFSKEVLNLKKYPTKVKLTHIKTWESIANDWKKISITSSPPINSNLRKNMWLAMKKLGKQGELPEDIKNNIFRHCMQKAFDRHKETRGKTGKEWSNYLNQNWDKLWESRSFYNPAEATIELSLIAHNYAYLGGLAKDEDVPSLIHHLGGTNVDKTKVSEDFILFSRKLKLPIFIQSKSSGGGMDGHGKNIQNRTKEQLARSLFYRGFINSKGDIQLRPKDFFWIGILDGNWGVTKQQPLKYIHMLQWAGYDALIGADSLTNKNLDLLANNQLTKLLEKLDCIKKFEVFEESWKKWCKPRLKRFRK